MALLADLVLPRPERSCGKVTSLCSPSNSTSLSDRFPSLQHGQQMTTNYYFYALYWPCLCCSVTRLHFTYSPSTRTTTPTFCAKYKLDLSVIKSLKRLTVPCLADDCQLDANITSADTLPLCHTHVVMPQWQVVCCSSPTLWNGLSVELHQRDIKFVQLKWLIKTFLFCSCGTLWLVCNCCHCQYCT